MSFSTTIIFHFIPVVSPETLIHNAKDLDVDQVTEDLFGANSVDAAALCALSYGAGQRHGVIHLSAEAARLHSDQSEIIRLDLPIDLIGSPEDFPGYAFHHYDTPRNLSLAEQIEHTILNGELAGFDEAVIPKSRQVPLSRHRELARLGEYAAAYASYSARTVEQ
jgi:hypothetical protein